jgi:acyl-CoA reductase-like NAD-dependent aldehyde dehydrogenase
MLEKSPESSLKESFAAGSFVKERYTPFGVQDSKRLAFETVDYRDLLSPWDRKRITSLGFMTEAQAFENLNTLKRTFASRAQPSSVERIAILRRAAARVQARHEQFSDLIAWEGGKPLHDARLEVTRAINSLEIAAEEAGHQAGREVPMRGSHAALGHQAWTVLEPIGVVFAISAFNHPLNLIVHQIAPAIATGCPVMIKPALETPLSCLHLLDELYEAGLPLEMCLPLIADTDIAEKVARSEDIGFFSFIGSAKVGWYLRSVLSPGVRFSLEHGGAAPVIVDSTANLEGALPAIVKGGFYHAGQVCVSVQRIFVHERIADEFTEKLVHQVSRLKTADPRLASTDCGPLIRSKEVTRIAEWINEARAAGGKTLCGGSALSETSYAPTVMVGMKASDRVMKDEVFGPLVCVQTFRDLDDAVVCANEVKWSFQSSVFTESLKTAFHLGAKLNASAVLINESPTFRVDWMPFRGNGPSGFGTGGIPYAMRDMVNEKMLVFKS